MSGCFANCFGGFAGVSATSSAASPEISDRRAVVKPPPLGESCDDGPQVESYEVLATVLGLTAAPPGARPAVAYVSRDFQHNPARLLVLVPLAGAPANSWDPSLPGSRGSAVPLLRWAQANNYAMAMFAGQDLKGSPALAWDRVLRGSPARYVAVAVAEGMLSVVHEALSQLHPLLLSRFRTLCVRSGDVVAASRCREEQAWSPELREHLLGATVCLPAAFEELGAQVARQRLFELLLEREERWQRTEMRKYQGFQGLKENDMPGLRRMSVEQRIERLDRDRGNDELARLLRKHEHEAGGVDSDEEPGVD